MLYRKIFSSGPSMVIAGSGVMKRQKSRKKSFFLAFNFYKLAFIASLCGEK